jgi:hypothetical protein
MAVHLLFQDELVQNERNYERIQIKETLLLPITQEVPRSWLEKYSGFITWQDFNYLCCHCNNRSIRSLGKLLKHFEEKNIATHNRMIKCPFKGCQKIFKGYVYLTSFLNHGIKHHKMSHLKFSCIFCEKVFVNVIKMTEHTLNDHSHTQNVQYYQCFECGLFCHTYDRLLNHKSKHNNYNS